jgi:hypothetical protein
MKKVLVSGPEARALIDAPCPSGAGRTNPFVVMLFFVPGEAVASSSFATLLFPEPGVVRLIGLSPVSDSA